MKIYSLKKQKHGYLIHTWSDKAFNGTVVNRAMSSVHGESLGNTLTVPLTYYESINVKRYDDFSDF